MSFDLHAESADQIPLIEPVPLDDLFAAYDEWNEEDDAIIARMEAIDSAVEVLRTNLNELGVSIGPEAGGDQLDSASQAVAELGGLRAEMVNALNAREHARRALADARNEAETSLAKIGDLHLARRVVIVLAVLLALITGVLVFGQ